MTARASRRRMLAGLSGLALALPGLTVAQEPPATPGRYPGRFSIYNDTAQEAAARAAVTEFATLLMAGKVQEAFEARVARDYRDHSHLVRTLTKTETPGYAETLAFFLKEFGSRPPPPGAGGQAGARAPMQISLEMRVNDDMVTQYSGEGVDIFQVRDGKIVRHWDATPMNPVTLKGELKAGS